MFKIEKTSDSKVNTVRTSADEYYMSLLNVLISSTTTCLRPSRNFETLSNFFTPTILFKSAPLVTVRQTLWRKAIREMEWFLSGDSKCPEELLDWWGGQISSDTNYRSGYAAQFRSSVYQDAQGCFRHFDQIRELQNSLQKSPFSRRHILTSWNPGAMSNIAEINQNPNTPATCHTTIAQFYVSNDNNLHMKTYQRSADVLLGVPHNWIQSWALLCWLAKSCMYGIGTLQWIFGDLHLYTEESHIKTMGELYASFTQENSELKDPCFVYEPTSTDFKSSDFDILNISSYSSSLSTIRPKLL